MLEPPKNQLTGVVKGYGIGNTNFALWGTRSFWCYKGVDGVYRNTNKSSHYAGFAGVYGTEKTEEEIVEYLTSGFIHVPTATIAHNFGGLIPQADREALAKFIKSGSIDTSNYIAPSGIIRDQFKTLKTALFSIVLKVLGWSMETAHYVTTWMARVSPL